MIANNDMPFKAQREELWAYRAVWVCCFALLLPVAFLASLSGWRWRPWSAGPNGYQSSFREAHSLASRAAGVAFSVF